MATDTSVKAWLEETGRKTFTRTKVFGLGLGKKVPITNPSQLSPRDRKRYYKWKGDTQKAEEQREINRENTRREYLGLPPVFEGFDDIVSNIVTTPSAREIANKKVLEQIKRINSVDLSRDTKDYIGNNEIESKYPGLIDSIFSEVASYGNEFRDDEEYAQVVVTDTINNKEEILNHVRWLISKPGSPLDVELRNVEEMGSWVLQTTSDVGMGVGTNSKTDLSVKPTEQPRPPRPRPILPPLEIPIGEIKKDAVVIGSNKLIPYDSRILNAFNTAIGSGGSSRPGGESILDTQRFQGGNRRSPVLYDAGGGFDNSDGFRTRNTITER